MHAILPRLAATDFPRLHRKALTTLQVNVGYRCNQQCVHCHVNAGPNRKEEMGAETVDLVIRFLQVSGVKTLDITGGAPELNAHFRRLVVAARGLGVNVIDRCNLTITEQPGQEDLIDFLAANRVEVIASLPCYLEENVDRQRGKHVFEASIRALKQLNAAGYGRPGQRVSISISSTTHSDPRCRRRRKGSRTPTGASWAGATASSSTGSSRSPTCRSSASAARSSRRASSSPT